MSKISSVKVQIFFNTPVTYFLKKAIVHSIAIFLFTYYACAAYNLVLLVIKKNLRIAGFFALIPFLTYLSNKRLKPSIHCDQRFTLIACMTKKMQTYRIFYNNINIIIFWNL